jgi:hypothetical protein
MADLSAGQHANVVLQADEVLHVESDGNTDVVMLYGGPDGTTAVNSASVDFGPYGVPAKLRIDVNTGTMSYYLRTYAPELAVSNGEVVVLATDTPATVKSKIETVNPESGMTDGVPWNDGVGRPVRLPAGRILTPACTVSQAQTVRGVKGSTVIAHDGSAIPDRGGNVGGFVTVLDDFRSHSGIAGQGVLEDLDIDATIAGGVTRPGTVHGLYHPPRSGSANAHTVRNVGVYNAPNNGIHYDVGNDKLVAQRLRQEGAGGVGIYIGGSDCKGSDFGSVAVGTAIEINGAAVELDKFDAWRRNNPTSDPTLKITGATNGCVVKSGTVEGKTLFIGKNESNSNRFINSKAQFAFVHFKLKDFAVDCLLELQSADMVTLIAPKFGLSGNGVASNPPDFLIKITNTGGADRNGPVKIIDASGMMRFVGRPGASNQMRFDALRHICDHPELLLFEWGRMGTVEQIGASAAGAIGGSTLKTHLACDGQTYNTADYPFGYLNLRAHLGDWAARLDTAPGTFTMPEYPALSSNCVQGLRCIL